MADIETIEKLSDELREAKLHNLRLIEAGDKHRLETNGIYRALVCMRNERDEALAEAAVLREALREIREELGVPQPSYSAPVANAYDIVHDALSQPSPGAQLLKRMGLLEVVAIQAWEHLNAPTSVAEAIIRRALTELRREEKKRG